MSALIILEILSTLNNNVIVIACLIYFFVADIISSDVVHHFFAFPNVILLFKTILTYKFSDSLCLLYHKWAYYLI